MRANPFGPPQNVFPAFGILFDAHAQLGRSGVCYDTQDEGGLQVK